MGGLAETRRLIASHTVGGCGMMHHYTWTHGKELPPCEVKLRDGRLDCAHSHHPALSEAIETLVSEPRIPSDFFLSIREAIAVARNALWIADLLAIELSTIDRNQAAGRPLTGGERREVEEINALGQDGVVDTSRCETAIKSAQAVGSAVMMAVRNCLLSVIDAIEEGRTDQRIVEVIASSRESLVAMTHAAEKIIFPETDFGLTNGALRSINEKKEVL